MYLLYGCDYVLNMYVSGEKKDERKLRERC